MFVFLWKLGKFIPNSKLLLENSSQLFSDISVVFVSQKACAKSHTTEISFTLAMLWITPTINFYQFPYV